MTQLSPDDVMSVLSRLTRERVGPLTTAIGGAITFVARDEGANWRLDLDVPGGAWTRGVASAASPSDTVFEGSAESFAALLLGAESIREQVRRGGLAVRGLGDRLERLGRLLARGGSLLEQRARVGAAQRCGRKETHS